MVHTLVRIQALRFTETCLPAWRCKQRGAIRIQNGVYSERVTHEADKLLLSSTQTASSQPQPSGQSLVLISHVNAVEIFASWLFHFSTPLYLIDTLREHTLISGYENRLRNWLENGCKTILDFYTVYCHRHLAYFPYFINEKPLHLNLRDESWCAWSYLPRSMA